MKRGGGRSPGRNGRMGGGLNAIGVGDGDGFGGSVGRIWFLW